MRYRRPLIPVAVAVAVAAVSLLAAGCGGGGGASAAAVGTSTTAAATTSSNRAVVFSNCMRSNGLPNYPDAGKPTPQQLGVSESRFRASVAACRYLLPNGGNASPEPQTRTQIADELSFARCMRSHGVGRFPDPTVQAGLTIEMVQAQGIDVHSPAVLRVVQTCLPASHGGLTAAKVRAALGKAGG